MQLHPQNELSMSDTTLTKAYQLASRLKELAPWSYMAETEIFGVRIPDSGKQYFVSIMGSGGQHYGMAAYEDTEGLLGFWELQQPTSWMRPGDLLLVPHLLVSFEDRDMIDEPVRKKMKELGFKYRGSNAWPDFRHMIPAFVPGMPGEQALNDLVTVMEQALDVFERAKTDTEFIYTEDNDGDIYLVRAFERTDDEPGQWKDTYWRMVPPKPEFNMGYNALERGKIAGLPRGKDTLQADIALTSKQVAKPGKKPYFASLYFVTSKQQGTVLDLMVLSPEDGIDTMHGRFPDLLIKTVLKLKWQPVAIEFRHPLFYAMAKKVLYPTKIKTVLKPFLPEMEKFLDSFEANV